MAISIHTNPSAAAAAVQLSKNVASHQTSLERLSSGSRIAKPSDDAGGNAVAMKMASAIRRSNAVSTNVLNALSFLQTQEAGLRQFSSILTRMSELTVFMQDVTKSEADLENYVTEMSVLSGELEKIQKDEFNGVRLFHTGGTQDPLQVIVSEDGSQIIELAQADLGALVFQNVIAFSNSIASIDAREEFDGLTLNAYRTALQEVSTLIGQNGASQSRINSALSSLSVNGVNLEASLSRIADVDVAAESTRLAKTKVLSEFSTTVLQQANANASVAQKLIGGA
jgi:flagellin